MTKLCYIAGPYRGASVNAVRANIRAAERAAEAAVRLGFYPVSPHACTAFFDGLAKDEHWLAGGLHLLKRCDALMLFGDWRASEGANKELELARSLNMPVYHHHEKILSSVGKIFDGDSTRKSWWEQPALPVDCPGCGTRNISGELIIADDAIQCPACADEVAPPPAEKTTTTHTMRCADCRQEIDAARGVFDDKTQFVCMDCFVNRDLARS